MGKCITILHRPNTRLTKPEQLRQFLYKVSAHHRVILFTQLQEHCYVVLKSHNLNIFKLMSTQYRPFHKHRFKSTNDAVRHCNRYVGRAEQAIIDNDPLPNNPLKRRPISNDDSNTKCSKCTCMFCE